MLNTFWIIVRKGPSHSDEIWYLNQLRQHFIGKLSEPEKLTMIADSSVDISDENYHAALLLKMSKKWDINCDEGEASITNYSDKEGYSGFVLSWKRKSDAKEINYRKLTEAAHEGDIKSIESLLDQGANINGKDEYGDTALVKASRSGHTEAVRFILDSGADVNLADKNFATPLIHAACSGWIDIVEILCDNGADLSVRDSAGKTAEDWAEFSSYHSIKDFLRSKCPIENQNDKKVFEPLITEVASKTSVEITDSTFEEMVLRSELPVLLKLTAPWCKQNKEMDPIFKELIQEYSGKLKFTELDTDTNLEVAAKYGVRVIPTLMIFKKGEVADTVIGIVSKEQLTTQIDAILASSISSSQEKTKETNETPSEFIKKEGAVDDMIKEMVSNLPTLGIYFDIARLDKLTNKFNTPSYGFVGWKIIFGAIDIRKLEGDIFLFDGDTQRTLDGDEKVWCAAFQTKDRNLLEQIRSTIEDDREFKNVASQYKFKENDIVIREPLPESGCLKNGKFVGNKSYDSYRALYSLTATSSEKRSRKWWQFWK